MSTESFFIAGVDEVGRGPLAGPVVAAAVILDPGRPVKGLLDSKLLEEDERQTLDNQIRQSALTYCIAEASVEEIDSINILQASLLAMKRAVSGLLWQPDLVLVDGNRLPSWSVSSAAIVKGDQRVQAISAASIIAKVARDRLMCTLHQHYPVYGFARHKGYPTPEHRKALHVHGASELHRQSFKPVREAQAVDVCSSMTGESPQSAQSEPVRSCCNLLWSVAGIETKSHIVDQNNTRGRRVVSSRSDAKAVSGFDRFGPFTTESA